MAAKSYSQVGEDLQIAYYLGSGDDRHYIDVGCLWPVTHSNTYYFYERGGQGLCIDPNPEVGPEYSEKRPRDLFVNCGVGADVGEMPYVMHANPVFNTFSPERAREVERKAAEKPGRRAVREVSTPVKPLSLIIDETGFLERVDGRIDFLSVDVEGLEAEVLQGVDFDRVRPRLVVVEHLRRGRRDSVDNSDVVRAMARVGYWVAGYTGHDLYFLDDRC